MSVVNQCDVSSNALIDPSGVDGCSNTHRAATSGHPEAVEVGIDTIRWRRFLRPREMRGVYVGQLREVDGYRVQVYGHGLLVAEGHPLAEGLCPMDELPAAREYMLGCLEAAGLPVGHEAGLGRVDATVTVRHEHRAEGIAMLTAAAAIEAPRMKPVVYGRPPQTVYLQGARSKKLYARIYDKGLESGLFPRGEYVRFEDQRRFDRGTARVLREHRPDLDFQRRFAPHAKAAHGVTVTTAPVIARELAERVVSGEISPRKAELLAGYVVMSATGAPRVERTARRRRAELRDLGYVVADELVSEAVTFRPAETIEAALGAWSRA